jgi:hypothetical protein
MVAECTLPMRPAPMTPNLIIVMVLLGYVSLPLVGRVGVGVVQCWNF